MPEETKNAAVSGEWKLVPVEPTPEMYAAASVDSREQGFIGAGYKAMLAATTVPPAGDVEVFTAIDQLCAEAAENGNSWHAWAEPRAELVKAYVTRLTAERDALKAEVSYLTGTLKQIASDNVDLQSELTKARELLNTPHTDDWFEGVRLEAGHQIGRWGTDHDAGKAPADWFWLIGYLAQKAMTAQMSGDEEKARHHTISTGAAMLNWFRAIVGDSNAMRPGVDAHQPAPAANAVFNDPLYNAESDARNASAMLEEVLELFDDGVGRSPEEFKLMRKIGNWLGRSAPAAKGEGDE
ncbi:hypothetical protein [Pseudomonas bohemica]|uniref:hypothetical protein n=1 Tax=Pseudomonas bohemica TaxID=2044872 RepID=UPI0018FE65E7|nr:hypothetical protein [Pseudomonas bohemica]